MKAGTSVVAMPEAGGRAFRRRLGGLAVISAVLVICFARPLYDLARYASHSELYSHIFLIPFISAYLIWPMRRDLAMKVGARGQGRGAALLLLGAGSAILGGYWLAVRSGWQPTIDDYLAAMTLSFLVFLCSGGFIFLGGAAMRQVAFPVALLIFMVPFPSLVRAGIEAFFQHGSAGAAYGLLTLSGMPVLREGMEFHLPGFALQVAPQCSGIHSSLVLFITSLLAGYLLLRTGWTRTVLVLAVIPLALFRNGARICVLGHLCVSDPSWIDSSLHHRGGPLFFVLSLVPFFFLLLLLRKWERWPRPEAGSGQRGLSRSVGE
jgi:exosortase C (VPDSG-CTERM-specific)